MNLVGLLSVFLAVGCEKVDVEWDDTSSSWEGADHEHEDHEDHEDHDDAEDEEAAAFSVTFSDTGVYVSVTNADMVGGYFFGMAQTGAGDAGWYGEDCVSSGSICHELYDTLSLAAVGAVGDVVANSTTLHSAAIESAVTYAFWGLGSSGDYNEVVYCGGDDCGYYGW